MDTATKTPQGPRATDRLLEALSTVSALLDRAINEVKSIDSDFQTRLQQAVHETEASIQGQAAQHLDTSLEETRAKLEEQFKNKTAELSAQWEAERNRLNTELGKITQTTAQWEAERARLNGELQRLASVQAATQDQAEKAILALKTANAAAKTAKPAGPTLNTEALSNEIKKTEEAIQKISALIEDPATELSTVIRKNVERAELESYLKGIRYAVNGGQPK